MNLKQFLLGGLFLCGTISTYAQDANTERIEFLADSKTENNFVFEFGSKGIIKVTSAEILPESQTGKDAQWVASNLLAQKRNIKNDRKWEVTFFNTHLDSLNSAEFETSKEFHIVELVKSGQSIHALLKSKENYELVSIDINSFTVSKQTGEVPSKKRITNLQVIGDYVLFNLHENTTQYLPGKRKYNAHESLSKRPEIVSLNWKTGERKHHPVQLDEIPNKKLKLLNIELSNDSTEAYIYVLAEVSGKRNEIYTLIFNDQGENTETYRLTDNVDVNIVDISFSKQDDETHTISGSYSKQTTAYSEGLFIGQLKDQKIINFKTYPFLEMTNFLNHMEASERAKIEKNYAKKGEAYKSKYQIASHKLTPVADGFLYIGEVYYPTFKWEEDLYNGGKEKVFNGYEYTHAIVCKIGIDGKLQWDQSFKMMPRQKPFGIKEFISITEIENNMLTLAFSSRGEIHLQRLSLDGNSGKAESSHRNLSTGNKNDHIKLSYTDLDFWYDKYFVTYGYQTIKSENQESKGKEKRKVFFMQKATLN